MGRLDTRPVSEQARWGSVVAGSNLACHRVAAFCPGSTEQSRAEQAAWPDREVSTKMCDSLLTNEPPNRGKNDKFAVATTTAAAAEAAAAESRATVAAGNDL